METDRVKTPLEITKEWLSDLVSEQKETRRQLTQSKLSKNHETTRKLVEQKATRRLRLRVLHLAACFLRGTPYKCVERKANWIESPTNIWDSIAWKVTDILIDVDWEPDDVYNEVEAWMKGEEE